MNPGNSHDVTSTHTIFIWFLAFTINFMELTMNILYSAVAHQSRSTETVNSCSDKTLNSWNLTVSGLHVEISAEAAPTQSPTPAGVTTEGSTPPSTNVEVTSQVTTSVEVTTEHSTPATTSTEVTTEDSTLPTTSTEVTTEDSTLPTTSVEVTTADLLSSPFYHEEFENLIDLESHNDPDLVAGKVTSNILLNKNTCHPFLPLDCEVDKFDLFLHRLGMLWIFNHHWNSG